MTQRDAILLACIPIVLAVCAENGNPVRAQEQLAKKALPQKLSRYGQPLPPGVVAEFGTPTFFGGFSWGAPVYARFSTDNKILFASYPNGKSKIWQVPDGKELATFTCEHLLGSSLPPHSKVPWFLLSNKERDKIHIRKGEKDHLIVEKLPKERRPKTGSLSASGDHFATAGSDHVVYVWKSTNGKQVHALKGHTDDVLSIEFAESGSHLVTISADRTARIWDLSTGQELFSAHVYEKPVKPEEGLPIARFSSDAKYLAIGPLAIGNRHYIHVWDVARKMKLHTSELSPSSLIFTPDSRSLVAGAGSVWLIDVATGKQGQQFREKDRKWFLCVAVSQDGQLMAGFNSYEAQLWNLPAGRMITSSNIDCGEHYFAIAFSPDGKWLATGGFVGHEVLIWEVATQKLVHRVKLPPRFLDYNDLDFQRVVGTFDRDGQRINAVEFSPDGKMLLVVAEDEYLRLYDVARGSLILKLAEEKQNDAEDGPPFYWKTGTFIRNGTIIASCKKNTICLWDVKTGKQLEPLKPNLPTVFSKERKGEPPLITKFDSPPYCWALAVCLENDNLAAVAGWDQEDYRQDEDGKIIHYQSIVMWLGKHDREPPRIGPGFTLGPPLRPLFYNQLSFNPDGTLLLCSTTFGLEVLESATLRPLLTRKANDPSERCLNIAALSPNGRVIAVPVKDWLRKSESGDGEWQWTLEFIEVWTGSTIAALPVQSPGIACKVIFTPDGKHLLVASPSLMLLNCPKSGSLSPELRKQTTVDLWNALRSENAEEAYAAMAVLVERPTETVAFVRTQIVPRSFPIPERQIRGWIADLGADQYATREKARKSLLSLGRDAGVYLHEARISTTMSLEGKRRAAELCEKLPKGPLDRYPIPVDQLQRLRGIQVLEWIGSRDVDEILATVSLKSPAYESKEARSALKRLHSQVSH